MQLPKYNKRNLKSTKMKICKEPSCGVEFMGLAITRYCDLHRDPSFRKREKRKKDDPSLLNKVFKHTFRQVTEVEFTCELEGCGNKFKTKIFPKQEVYPKFCPEHVNEFKRQNFLRQKEKKC